MQNGNIQGLRIFTVSGLEKIFPHTMPVLIQNSGSALKGERFSFQLCLVSDSPLYCTLIHKSDILCNVYEQDYVPAAYSAPRDHDDYIIDENITAFPEVLRPYKGDKLILSPGVNKPLWVACKADKAGEYTISFKLVSGTISLECEYVLNVSNAEGAENDLIVTRWIHYDCIANSAGVKPFSHGFYDAVENYYKAAVLYGHNMVYVPLFTPPLDTAVGGERLTVQSVKVIKTDSGYNFDFTDFDKLIALAKKCGFKYFELSHLFSQWGAKHCPKIIAQTSCGEKRIFGWETLSESEEYKGFLTAFLLRLCERLKYHGILCNSFIHVSDEPNADCLERYGRLSALIRSLIPGVKMIDAMSHYEFYKNGFIDVPVVAIDSVLPFTEANADFWVYYCCSNYKQRVSNAFFNMPLVRTRIIGIQAYLTKIKGFLQWGFNFYNSGLSYYPVNPYVQPSAGGAFPAGDAFIVYPAENGGVFGSIRAEAFLQAMEDYRALKALEKYVGRDKVVKMLNKRGYEADFTHYDTSAQGLTSLRKEINDTLNKLVK